MKIKPDQLCGNCSPWTEGNKEWNCRMMLKRSTHPRRFKCEVCGENYAYYRNKMKHEDQCAGKDASRSKLKTCPRCLVPYANMSSLRRHLLTCTHRHREAVNSQSEGVDRLRYNNNLRKKWKFCFYENCFCTFYHITHLIKHIYSCHDDTLKYGIQMLEFESMEKFDQWRSAESARTHSYFVVRARNKKYTSYVCQHDDVKGSDMVKRKTGKKWFKGVVKQGKMCMSRILVVKNADKIICTYLNIHSHDLKPENLKYHRFDKEFYNKIKSYICMGVDVDEIYNELIVKNSDNTHMLHFKEHFRYAKKNISEMKRQIKIKMKKGEPNSCLTPEEISVEADLPIIEADQMKVTPIELEESNCSIKLIPLSKDTLKTMKVHLKRKMIDNNLSEPEVPIIKNKVVLLKRIGKSNYSLLPISKANQDLINITPIRLTEESHFIDHVYAKQLDKKEITQPYTPLQAIKEKVAAIKQQISDIHKQIDSTCAVEDLYYIGDLVDTLARKCESTCSVRTILSEKSQSLKDASTVILKHLKYSENLAENILYLNSNKIVIPLVDFLTLVTPSSSSQLSALCKKANPNYQEGQVAKSIVDAFFYRHSQNRDNAHFIFGNSTLSQQLLHSTPEYQSFFSSIDFSKKTHLFLPVHTGGNWMLIVFNLEHRLYGVLNPVKPNDMEQDVSVKTVIANIKLVLPKVSWRQMTFLRVYHKNVESSGVFICFYLECLTKKLPLSTSFKVNKYRLIIFTTIKNNCLRLPRVDVNTCTSCKESFTPPNIQVRCRECLTSYHKSCVKPEDCDDFVCNNL